MKQQSSNQSPIAVIEYTADDVVSAAPQPDPLVHDSRTPAGREQALEIAAIELYATKVKPAVWLSIGLGAVACSALTSVLPLGAILVFAGLLLAASFAQMRHAQRNTPRARADAGLHIWLQEFALGLAWAVLGVTALTQGDAHARMVTVVVLICAALLGLLTRAAYGHTVAAHIVTFAVPSVAAFAYTESDIVRVAVLAFAFLICAIGGSRLAGETRSRLQLHLQLEETQELCKALTHHSMADAAREEFVFSTAKDGLIIVDASGRVQSINQAALSLCGWSDAQALNKPLDEIVRLSLKNTTETQRAAIAQALKTPTQSPLSQLIEINVRRSSTRHTVEFTVCPIEDAQGTLPARSLITLRDQTEQEGLAKLMRFRSTHDLLTGLLNRAEFETAIRRVHAQTNGAEHTLFYLNVDNLNRVNDACGYASGDQLLRDIADCLLQLVRDGDTIARLGGDRFAIFFANCDSVRAMGIAQRMRDAVSAIEFPWQDQVFSVTASIGVTHTLGLTGGVSELLSAAGSACHVAKQRGGNRVEFYQRDDAAMHWQDDQRRWMTHVQNAITNDAFALFVQKIVPIDRTSALRTHGEFLVRVRDENGVLTSAQAFILAAERYQLMPNVDRWVIRNALAALNTDASALRELDAFTINLSAQSLSDPDLLSYVLGELKTSGVPPSRICFEITETAVMEHIDVALDFMLSLKAVGCRFALDDFGSGSSSYGYLKQLPVDFIKIDGGFVRTICSSATDRAVVESINQIGQALGKATIAEFAENDAIVTVLRDIGVDYAQGSALGEPEAVFH